MPILSPSLTAPILLQPFDLKLNHSLTSQIISLTNAAFKRSKQHDLDKWRIRPRFLDIQSYHDQMLVDGAIVAVILDQGMSASESVEASGNEKNKEEGERLAIGTVVACAAAVPWAGGWHHEGLANSETSFEIKALAVDGSPRYLKKGLAIQVMDTLEDELIRQEREKNGHGNGTLHLWVLVAECINGEYWKRRGYREVRRSTEGDMVWGCQTSFELVVCGKEVEF